MQKIEINGKTFEMRAPKVRDMRAVANVKSQEEKEICLISNLTGLSSQEIDDLDIKDYKKLQEGLEGFLS